jgi:uncharacterized protein YjiS (DUF1127 family)
MTYTSTDLTAGLFDRLSAFGASLKARHASYKVYRTTLSELQNLGSRELADLGINRSMIKRIAYEAAYLK